MFPVFSLVLDSDVTAHTALTYPELYKELSKGRSMSMKTFFIWVLISIYQGVISLFMGSFFHVLLIVSSTFSKDFSTYLRFGLQKRKEIEQNLFLCMFQVEL